MRVRWGWAALAAAPVLAGGLWWASARPAEDPAWTAATVEDLVLGVEVTGTLQAVDTSRLSPPSVPDVWDFKISFMAPEGREVKTGTPVLRFDTSELERKLQEMTAESEGARAQIEKRSADRVIERRSAELRLEEARARLRKADLKLDRPEELVARSELRTTRREQELARTEVAHLEEKLRSDEASWNASLSALRDRQSQAERRVREIQEAIAAMSVAAPRDGTVVYTSDWRGEKPKVGDRAWRGDPVLEIPDLRAMQALGEVDEADAGRVEPGQKVTLRLDAHPDTAFAGTVKQIRRTVQRQSWRNPLKVVRLEIALDATDTRKMRPGMRFRGRVETERAAQVLTVPAEAVFLTDAGPVVYRRSAMGYEARPVVLGRRNEERVEVTSGLSAGDEVARRDLAAAERRRT